MISLMVNDKNNLLILYSFALQNAILRLLILLPTQFVRKVESIWLLVMHLLNLVMLINLVSSGVGGMCTF